jgi:hypothetical protein
MNYESDLSDPEAIRWMGILHGKQLLSFPLWR